MLRIDRLRLQLPPGFEHRAEGIARLVGDALGRRPVSGDRRIARLAPPAVEITAGTGDREIAGRVAAAIHRQIGEAG